ncbi:hypothetical protein CRX72_05830 [Pantoea sp. BRM17]|nr:hypothetical protein CRX72_05830 [Pantoea sp. BRM17]
MPAVNLHPLAFFQIFVVLKEVGDLRFHIDASTLGELDALRCKNGEYKRQLIQTPYGSAWLYVYQRSVAGRPHIASGDWLQRDDAADA